MATAPVFTTQDKGPEIRDKLNLLSSFVVEASGDADAAAAEAAAAAVAAEAARVQAVAAAAQAQQIVIGGTTGLPSILPSMLNDFANGRALDPRLTFTRAGAATYVDQLGRLRTAASGMPVFEFDAAARSLGYRSEPSRTNLILNSATMATQSATVTAQVYTLSFSGTGTVTRSGASAGASVGTGASNRVSFSFTPTAGSLTLTVSGSVTNAQLEAGSSATSYIPTVGSAVTRPADVLTLPAAAAADVMNAAQGSFLAIFTLTAAPTDANPGFIFEYSDGTGSNRLVLFYESAGIRWRAHSGGAIVASASTSVPAVIGDRVCVACAWSVAGVRISINGGAVLSAAATGAMPSGMNRLDVFNARGFSSNAGYFGQLNPYSRPLTDAELRAASAI